LRGRHAERGDITPLGEGKDGGKVPTCGSRRNAVTYDEGKREATFAADGGVRTCQTPHRDSLWAPWGGKKRRLAGKKKSLVPLVLDTLSLGELGDE